MNKGKGTTGRVRSFGKLNRTTKMKTKCSVCNKEKSSKNIKAKGWSLVCKSCINNGREDEAIL